MHPERASDRLELVKRLRVVGDEHLPVALHRVRACLLAGELPHLHLGHAVGHGVGDEALVHAALGLRGRGDRREAEGGQGDDDRFHGVLL
jgi:hypothetical protein